MRTGQLRFDIELSEAFLTLRELIEGMMYGAFLALALAASTNSDALSVNDLNKAIETPAVREAPASLAGRRFHLVLRVVTDRPQTLQNFQSPARWRYRRGDETLEISIGLGQISPQNYDQYATQGLATLPPLQTLYFTTNERRRSLFFSSKDMMDSKDELGDGRNAVSYGLAVPYAENAPSGLPKGFLPSMVYQTKLEPRYLEQVVDGLTLQIDGEITELGDKPTLICGAFSGGLKASSVTGDLPIWIDDKQCFVTARIDSALISNSAGTVLVRWGGDARH